MARKPVEYKYKVELMVRSAIIRGRQTCSSEDEARRLCADVRGGLYWIDDLSEYGEGFAPAGTVLTISDAGGRTLHEISGLTLLTRRKVRETYWNDFPCRDEMFLVAEDAYKWQTYSGEISLRSPFNPENLTAFVDVFSPLPGEEQDLDTISYLLYRDGECEISLPGELEDFGGSGTSGSHYWLVQHGVWKEIETDEEQERALDSRLADFPIPGFPE